MAYGSAIFTAAQTATPLVTPPPGMFVAVRRIAIYCNNANSVNTQASIGFGMMGAGKVITGHPGIAAGSGFVEIAPQKENLGTGVLQETLSFTCGAPTSGSIQVNFGYELYNG